MTSLTQFALFVLVGGLAAIVNIVARLGFSLVTPFEVAVLLAFPVALTTAFVLNRHFVFDARGGRVSAQYARFLIVNLVALVQVFVVSVLLARVLFPWAQFTWNADTVAHVIGVLSPILTSFVFHKTFTFRGGGTDLIAADAPRLNHTDGRQSLGPSEEGAAERVHGPSGAWPMAIDWPAWSAGDKRRWPRGD